MKKRLLILCLATLCGGCTAIEVNGVIDTVQGFTGVILSLLGL